LVVLTNWLSSQPGTNRTPAVTRQSKLDSTGSHNNARSWRNIRQHSRDNALPVTIYANS
jgi:hypothetical protein